MITDCLQRFGTRYQNRLVSLLTLNFQLFSELNLKPWTGIVCCRLVTLGCLVLVVPTPRVVGGSGPIGVSVLSPVVRKAFEPLKASICGAISASCNTLNIWDTTTEEIDTVLIVVALHQPAQPYQEDNLCGEARPTNWYTLAITVNCQTSTKVVSVFRCYAVLHIDF